MNGMGGSFTGIGGSHAPEYALLSAREARRTVIISGTVVK